MNLEHMFTIDNFYQIIVNVTDNQAKFKLVTLTELLKHRDYFEFIYFLDNNLEYLYFNSIIEVKKTVKLNDWIYKKNKSFLNSLKASTNLNFKQQLMKCCLE